MSRSLHLGEFIRDACHVKYLHVSRSELPQSRRPVEEVPKHMEDTDDAQQVADNYAIFRDCFFNALIATSDASSKPNNKSRKVTSKKKDVLTSSNSKSTTASSSSSSRSSDTTANDPSELADFSDFIANEIFLSFPSTLQTLTHTSLSSNADLLSVYDPPMTHTTLESLMDHISPTVIDTLTTYAYIRPSDPSFRSDLSTFISPILNAYITSVTTPPATSRLAPRPSSCELCDRDWIPLTYHHLIPKSVHAKVLKRGWHDESVLNSVAWLCRACHSFVHGLCSNEELAREWFTVERLAAREDVTRWCAWVGRVRWKKS